MNPGGPIVGFSIAPTKLNEGDSLTVTFNVNGMIPEGGLEVNVDSDVFASLGEFAIFDMDGNPLFDSTGIAGLPAPNEDASGFSVMLTENTATLTIDVFDDGANEGIEMIDFFLRDGENYNLALGASEVTITIDDGDQETFFGTGGSDVFDANVPNGFNGSNDLVFAGAGDDLIDTSAALGNNRIYAQSGNDTLFLGNNNRAFGDSGNDVFYLLDGKNTISGGSGSDQFWLAAGEVPNPVNTITDFERGVDVLGIGGLDLSFGDLTFTQQGNSTLISADEQKLAKLLGVNANQLSASDFVFA
ncbi:calcium-binding protein [Aphanothece hegewaldii CCALA 016]|uniref:Calcium-binding protein n=2 Tax=Aphanothece TaxID=1121 RepID=A0A2T1LYD6_9CHRO|nr:calcium-binding protein [Aphanothece hegewaldii CCALA 016]